MFQRSAGSCTRCIRANAFPDNVLNCSQVLKFGTPSRYYKDALTQKRSYIVLCTTFRSDFHASWKNQNNHSTLNSSFNTLSKWHEPDIKITSVFWSKFDHFGHRDILRTVIFFPCQNILEIFGLRHFWALLTVHMYFTCPWILMR